MFEVLVLILLEILFVIILFIFFQDNEALLKMNFIWKHSFSKITMQKCYKGEYFYFPHFVFNDNE